MISLDIELVKSFNGRDFKVLIDFNIIFSVITKIIGNFV